MTNVPPSLSEALQSAKVSPREFRRGRREHEGTEGMEGKGLRGGHFDPSRGITAILATPVSCRHL